MIQTNVQTYRLGGLTNRDVTWPGHDLPKRDTDRRTLSELLSRDASISISISLAECATVRLHELQNRIVCNTALTGRYTGINRMMGNTGNDRARNQIELSTQSEM